MNLNAGSPKRTADERPRELPVGLVASLCCGLTLLSSVDGLPFSRLSAVRSHVEEAGARVERGTWIIFHSQEPGRVQKTWDFSTKGSPSSRQG